MSSDKIKAKVEALQEDLILKEQEDRKALLEKKAIEEHEKYKKSRDQKLQLEKTRIQGKIDAMGGKEINIICPECIKKMRLLAYGARDGTVNLEPQIPMVIKLRNVKDYKMADGEVVNGNFCPKCGFYIPNEYIF